jgi:hypothetical protein
MYREKEATLEVGTVHVTSFGDCERENLVEASVGPDAKPSTLPTTMKEYKAVLIHC